MCQFLLRTIRAISPFFLTVVVGIAPSLVPRVRADIIDSFSVIKNVGMDGISVGTGSLQQSFAITPSVANPLGSSRELYISQATSGAFATLAVYDDARHGQLLASATAISQFEIRYGSQNLLHFDATAGGASGFRLTFDSIVGDFQYAIIVGGYGYPPPNQAASNGGVLKPLTSVIDVPFASFSNAGTVNFGDLAFIGIHIENSSSSQLSSVSLTKFETAAVPEPSSIVFGGVAALSLAVAARKRRMGHTATPV